ncbi:MAG: thiamine-phosphate kinase [Desulfuromonas sp.]|nr:MAG: thiamine-phosphate kinase [Desulfuromonas sp.]
MTEQQNRRLGEFELIEWIREQAGTGTHLTLGIGDDCCIQRLAPDQELLTTTDLLIEDVHFKRQWTSLYDLGRKAAAVNLSDIAAMGGQPLSLYLGIGRPTTLDDSQVKELLSGFIYQTRLAGAVLVGGDTCGSPGPLMLSVTVEGSIPCGCALRRDGARVGDSIYVSGTLGDSALGLKHLLAGKEPSADLAARFHTPEPRLELGQWLVAEGLATAMLDVSDGLISDLGHILQSSAVGAEIALERLPLSAAFARELAADRALYDLALAGGEDYELLFTAADSGLEQRNVEFPVPITRIGRICAEPGLRIVQADGTAYTCSKHGFDHFAGS